jgi:PHD/YefM family antitoxin component YafN of YafNO toxin-antitoxin module
MSKMTVKEAGEALVRTVRRVRDERERFVLTEDGKPVAALVTAEDLAFLEGLEERIDLEEARKALAEGGDPIPFETIRRELGLD